MTPPVLYQFPFSHYCEKTRWHLDAKSISHEVRDLVPGLHRAAVRRLEVAGTVPILLDGDRVLGDSTTIAHHLESSYGGRSLLPEDENARARVLELEQRFDETIGPDVRLWIYGVLMEHGSVAGLWRRYYGWRGRFFLTITSPVLGKGLRANNKIDPSSVRAARERIGEQLAELEELIGSDPLRYLVGDTLTLADVTAASLLAPLVGPDGSAWEMPEAPDPLLELREEVRASAAGAWVLERYRRDR